MRERATGNRTLSCSQEELKHFSSQILFADRLVPNEDITGRIIAGDALEIAGHLPKHFADPLILDPPYNRARNFNGNHFRKRGKEDYQAWFGHAVESLLPSLKPSATIYVCSDWQTSVLMAPILESFFHVRNRITWEREKGRGAKSNWKNNTEDIWFCTVSHDYHFNVEAVKLKRRVRAPYRANGMPKDWTPEETGNFRLTHPSNIWTDVTVPFWSMPENTDHPTQKPEKLIAKLVLASTREGDFVFDPFLGSGTSAVVAKKLGRDFGGIEINTEYCCWALKRLAMADAVPAIQGYGDGVFWERNTHPRQPRGKTISRAQKAPVP